MYNGFGESMKLTVNKPWLMWDAAKSLKVSEFFDFYKISQKKRRKLLHENGFLINGKPVTEETLINKNDCISVFAFDEENQKITASEKPCEVVYEDDFVLVVNKPSGLIIHSDGAALKETLDQRVCRYYLDTLQGCSVRHLHRLDEKTTGCVLYSKCSFFQPFLDFLLSEKKIHREYVAVVKGIIPWEKKSIDLPIGKDRHHNQRQRISKTGKPAITDVSVLKRCKAKNTTLIHCRLHTGRTHQIRVHMSALGYPLVNDELYGSKDGRISQMGLHAYRLTWQNPLTLKEQTVCTSIPKELTDLVDGFEILGVTNFETKMVK